MRKYLLILAIVVTFICSSCGKTQLEEDKYIDPSEYTYPDSPATELRDYLLNDIAERALPLEVGMIEQVKWNGQEREEFRVYNPSNHQNECIFSFVTKYSPNDYFRYYNGNDPSFKIAFTDPDNSQDMIDVLTSVIMYLDPNIALQEAEQLATKQDSTISIDGYSVPQDIGGYQIQSHYTNPHDYFTTENFTAQFGVSVTSLKRIWGGGIDFSKYRELSEINDFWVLDHYDSWKVDATENRTVYADFVVKDWWQHEDYLHGNVITIATVESLHGQQYTLNLDCTRAPYELGIGNKYTFFIIHSTYGGDILYAVQHTGR